MLTLAVTAGGSVGVFVCTHCEHVGNMGRRQLRLEKRLKGGNLTVNYITEVLIFNFGKKIGDL